MQRRFAEETAGKKHDEAILAHQKRARNELKDLFCVKYHQAKSETLNTVSVTTPEAELYFDLLKRRANVTPGESLRFYTERAGHSNHPGITPKKLGDPRRRNQAEKADRAYHGGQFYNGEW